MVDLRLMPVELVINATTMLCSGVFGSGQYCQSASKTHIEHLGRGVKFRPEPHKLVYL